MGGMNAFGGDGKYAVITGAGSGINLEFVKLLLAKGTSVMVGDLALRPEAQEIAKKYPADGSGPKFIWKKIDVVSWPQLTAFWKEAIATFPHVDLVLPGAGIYDPDESSFWLPPGVDGSPSTDDPNAEVGCYRTFAVDLIHPVRLAQLAVSYWSTTKTKGHLLFIGSICGYTATIGTPLYYSAKAGLHNFIRSLAPIKRRLGVRVVGVAPGATRTPLWDGPHCKDKLTDEDPQLKADYVAKVLMSVLQNERYGDGNIIEIIDLGTAEEPNPSTREVPLHLLYPEVSGVGVPTLVLEEEKLWDKLETTGFKAY